MQDDQQAFRLSEMGKCFGDGQFPCLWVPDAGYGYGYPLFEFYPPSVYYVGTLIHSFGFQYIDTVKILFVLGFITSGLTMFVFLRSLLGPRAAVLGSFLYVYAPFRAMEVYVRGALNESWALALFPLIFWAEFRLISTRQVKYLAWLSVSIAFLVTTHLPMSLIFLPVAAVWAIALLFMNQSYSALPKLIGSWVLGVCLSGFFLIPVIFEKSFVHTESLLGGYFDYRQHFVSVGRLLFSNIWGYGSSGLGQKEPLSLSTGIIHWLVGLLGVIIALVNFKKKPRLAFLAAVLAVVEVVVLFMIHQRSSFIWERISLLAYLQFPWRFLGVSIFLLSILSSLTIYFVKNHTLSLVFTVCVIVAVLVLHLNFFQPNGWLNITDQDKFSGTSWTSQQTSSIFDYLPIYAKLPPSSRAPDVPEVLNGNAVITNYQKGSNFQTGTVEAKSVSVIRFPLFDYPGMEVTVNDQVVPHVNNDCRGEPFCEGLITFTIPSGQSVIKVKLQNTPIRNLADILSVSGLVVAIILLFNRNKSIAAVI